ncbi:hypothetical protein [Paracoccus seriniphilus]|uniref:Uncharacterized protein n=1 Tax=Paracoccus seriniphilus TaxID=184748 RepID=A0A239Q349_9RHOB|nr:hypothetical protein [Paracoccus seriniphilus]WCR13203.1 hypothetical protein JHW44_09645 [Paracoccus seriniphilus]SNT76696.1 hypothetical protein SAMN05444959_1253 [Paracoccus seriniphilus]
MRHRNEGAQAAPEVVETVETMTPASISITREGLSVWQGGRRILLVDHCGLPGIAQRCLIAWHEGQ